MLDEDDYWRSAWTRRIRLATCCRSRVSTNWTSRRAALSLAHVRDFVDKDRALLPAEKFIGGKDDCYSDERGTGKGKDYEEDRGNHGGVHQCFRWTRCSQRAVNRHTRVCYENGIPVTDVSGTCGNAPP